MYTNETKDQFIELRAQGLSLARIAAKLGVSKRTLIDWNRQCQDDIKALRAVELEALQEKILASREQELTRLVALQNRLEQDLVVRSFKYLPGDRILRASLLVRREIESLRADLSLLDKAPAQPHPSSSKENSPEIPVANRANGSPLQTEPAPQIISQPE